MKVTFTSLGAWANPHQDVAKVMGLLRLGVAVAEIGPRPIEKRQQVAGRASSRWCQTFSPDTSDVTYWGEGLI